MHKGSSFICPMFHSYSCLLPSTNKPLIFCIDSKHQFVTEPYANAHISRTCSSLYHMHTRFTFHTWITSQNSQNQLTIRTPDSRNTRTPYHVNKKIFCFKVTLYDNSRLARGDPTCFPKPAPTNLSFHHADGFDVHIQEEFGEACEVGDIVSSCSKEGEDGSELVLLFADGLGGFGVSDDAARH